MSTKVVVEQEEVEGQGQGQGQGSFCARPKTSYVVLEEEDEGHLGSQRGRVPGTQTHRKEPFRGRREQLEEVNCKGSHLALGPEPCLLPPPMDTDSLAFSDENPFICGIGECRHHFVEESHLYQHFQAFHKMNLVFFNNDNNTLLPFTASPSSNGDPDSPSKQLVKGERRYPCGFPGCKWVFTRSNHVLRHHQRVHPGFKPVGSPKEFARTYRCDYPSCDQLFRTLTALTRHKRYVHLMIAIQEQMNYIASNGFHSDIPKPFVCDCCSKAFTRRDHLRRHVFHCHTCLEPEVEVRELEPEVLLKVEENLVWEDSRVLSAPHPPEAHHQTQPQPLPLPHPQPQPQMQMQIPNCSSPSPSPISSPLFMDNSHPIKFHLKPKRPYICDVNGCEKSYTKHSHLVRHKVETHKMQKPEPKQRGSGSNFIPPPPINLVDRPFVCEWPSCKWSFKRQYHLDRHFLTHRMPVVVKSVDAEGNVIETTQETDCFENQNFDSDDDSLHSYSNEDQDLPLTSTQALSYFNPDPLPENPESLELDSNLHSLDGDQNYGDSERGFLCDQPGCGRRFRKKLFMDQHFMTLHSGPSNGRTALSEPKCPPKMSSCQELQDSSGSKNLLAGNSLLSNSLLANSLLNNCLTQGKGLELEGTSSCLQPLQPLPVTQLKLLQALTNNNKSNNATFNFTANQKYDPDLGSSILFDEEETGGEGENEGNLQPIAGETTLGRTRKRIKREKGVFICEICEKKFGRNCELTRHKLNHSDVWPFSCEYAGCGRRFKRKDVFKNHQRTHKREGEEGSDSQEVKAEEEEEEEEEEEVEPESEDGNQVVPRKRSKSQNKGHENDFEVGEADVDDEDEENGDEEVEAGYPRERLVEEEEEAIDDISK